MSNKIIIDDEVYEKIDVIMDVISEYLHQKEDDTYISICGATVSSLLDGKDEEFCFEKQAFDDGSYLGDVYVTKEVFKMSKENLSDPSLYEYVESDKNDYDDIRYNLTVSLNKSRKLLKEI